MATTVTFAYLWKYGCLIQWPQGCHRSRLRVLISCYAIVYTHHNVLRVGVITEGAVIKNDFVEGVRGDVCDAGAVVAQVLVLTDDGLTYHQVLTNIALLWQKNKITRNKNMPFTQINLDTGRLLNLQQQNHSKKAIWLDQRDKSYAQWTRSGMTSSGITLTSTVSAS